MHPRLRRIALALAFLEGIAGCASPGKSPEADRSPDSVQRTKARLGPLRDGAFEIHFRPKGQGEKHAPEVVMRAESYIFGEDGVRIPGTEPFVEYLLGQPVAKLAELGAQLTEDHGRNGGSFAKINEDGTKVIFTPEAQAVPALVTEAEIKATIASTAPVLRALREVLQYLYSTPKAQWSLDHFGLEPADASRLLSVFRESIYFEPSLTHANMKDYPFLMVSGFDAPMGKIGEFFEFNLGTPSGLSNLVQLLEQFRIRAPEAFEKIRPLLRKDKTFENLRRTTESCAQRWTGRDDGISVIFGPGPGNGAHPDVSAIAEFTGMPLVNPHDLYIDSEGWVRLRTTKREEDPIVTGIYARAEESYLLSEGEAGVPMRNPYFTPINEKLSQSIGLKLEPGVAYRYVYDASGKPTDVHRSSKGEPELDSAWDAPLGIGGKPGTIVDAIVNRKVYVSNVGGRQADDKRVFEIASRVLAKKHLRRGETLIAAPPETLRPNEYEKKLYTLSDEELGRIVIKKPDDSGGVGIHLLINEEPARRRQILAETVKKNPAGYEVQKFATYVALFGVHRDQVTPNRLVTLANDFRAFSFMNAEGEVSSGPFGFLVRVAKFGSSSTNTSQGAGYGLAFTVAESAVPENEGYRADQSLLPQPKAHRWLSDSQEEALVQYAYLLNPLLDLAERGEKIPAWQADAFLAAHRGLMAVLGRKFSPMMDAVERAKAGKLTSLDLARELGSLRDELLGHSAFPSTRTAEVLRSHVRPSIQTLSRSLATAPLPQIIDTGVTSSGPDGRVYRRVEHSRYTAESALPALQDAVRALTDAGGEIRAHEFRDDKGQAAPFRSVASFRVDDQGRPILGIDMLASDALGALRYEMSLFQDWRKLRDRNIHDESLAQAGVRAFNELNRAPLRSLRKALGAELRVRTDDATAAYRTTLYRKASAYHERGYIAVALFPDVRQLELILRDPANRPQARLHLDRMLARASVMKTLAIRRLREQAEAHGSVRNAASQARHARLIADAQALEATREFDLIFTPANLTVFTDQTKAALHELAP